MKMQSMAQMLAAASAKPTKEERLAFLRENDSVQVRQMLVAALDPGIVWLLPEGTPPFTPTEANAQFDLETVLYNEIRKFYLFFASPNRLFGAEGNANLTVKRRETLFIQTLEAVASLDAELMCAAKDKKLPESMANITVDLINEAFPGINIPATVEA